MISMSKKRGIKTENVPVLKEQIVLDDDAICDNCHEQIDTWTITAMQTEFNGPIKIYCNNCSKHVDPGCVGHPRHQDDWRCNIVPPLCCSCEKPIESIKFHRLPTACDEEPQFMCLECGDEYTKRPLTGKGGRGLGKQTKLVQLDDCLQDDDSDSD